MVGSLGVAVAVALPLAAQDLGELDPCFEACHSVAMLKYLGSVRAATMTDTDKRVRIERAGVVRMALPAAEAFPLFNAAGERRWVAGWDPLYVYPVESGVGEGAVFQTRKDAGTATWIQTRHEPDTGAASFVYVVPDHHTAIVDVGVTPDGSGRSRAAVRYRMTSLSSDADDFVRAFGAAFDDFMVHWEQAIQRHILEGIPLPGE